MHVASRQEGAPAVPSWPLCALTLVAMRRRLIHDGLDHAIRYAHPTRTARVESEGHREIVEKTSQRVAICGALLPGRARCLEQSLSVVRLMRAEGIPVEFRIGVQPYGFVAHAWVEHNGQPIRENDEVIRRVIPFPTLPVDSR